MSSTSPNANVHLIGLSPNEQFDTSITCCHRLCALMKHQMTGNAGLFHIAWELSRRGWNVMPTVRNARGADLYASPNDNEDAVISVQSKALSKRMAVPLGTDLDRLRSKWWIIPLNANSDDPVCWHLVTMVKNVPIGLKQKTTTNLNTMRLGTVCLS